MLLSRVDTIDRRAHIGSLRGNNPNSYVKPWKGVEDYCYATMGAAKHNLITDYAFNEHVKMTYLVNLFIGWHCSCKCEKPNHKKGACQVYAGEDLLDYKRRK